LTDLILPPSAQRHLAERDRAAKRQRIDEFIQVAKSFLGPGGGAPRQMGQTGVAPGSPMSTSWSSQLGNAALLQRATQTYAQQHNVPAAELEQALSDQGLSWSQPFAPGRPLDPFAGYRAPARVRSYQVGENVQVTPRHGRVSFETLKALYGAWDVPQICVQHLINDVRSLDISWLPADGVKSDVSADIDAAKAFFLCPDRRRPFRTWLAQWLQDIFRWDAGALYIRRNRKGDPIALETVDGTTILPLADYYGRIPMDEHDDDSRPGDELDGDMVPAYMQVIQGMPWDWLTAEDLIYQPLNPVPESQYGLAALEKILLSGNTDVRFQMHFLNYFTDGTLPAGLMEAPPDMSDPAQVQEWQDTWDALMAGDQAMLRRIRWVPSGTKFDPVKNSDFDEKFPLYLMRRCCAAYGVTPSDMGFTEQVNKATGDTQIDIQFRVGTRPPNRHVEDILSLFAQRDLGLRVKLQIDDGREVEDRVATAQAHSIYIQAGVESPDEVRDEIGKPTDKTQAVSRFVQTRTGIVPLEALLGQTRNPVDPETFAPAGKVEYVPPAVPPAPAPPAAGSEPAAGAGEQAQASDSTPAGEKPAIPGGQDAANTSTSPVAKADADIGKRSGMVSLDLPKGLLPIHEDGIDDHHITVVFLGENVADDLFKQACDRAAKVAADTPPLTGTIGGLGTFAPGEDGTPVFAVPDVPGLDDLRAAFEDLNASEHAEFEPHVTLTYHQPGDPMPEPTPETPVTFGALSVHRGDDCQSFPFTGGAASKAQTAGITVATGIQGADLLGHHDKDEGEDDEDDEIRKALIDVSLRRWRSNARNRLRKGQAPRRFVDPTLPAGVSDAVWARLQHAGTRAEVDAAFAGIPKARARKAGTPSGDVRPKDRAPTLADFHRHADEIAGHYAPLIAAALSKLCSEQTIRQAYDAATGAGKAIADPPPADTPPGAAVQAPAGDLAQSAQALRELLAELYGDAALQGAHEAAHAAGATIVSSLHSVTLQLPEHYWDTWEPGWGAAAAKDAQGGLKALLDEADITINGVTDSALERIGSALADGLARGDSFETTAKAVQDVVASPEHAALIANTEYGRAMSAASIDTYQQAGVEQCDWLAEASACEQCAANADGSPYALDDAPTQPAHPACRCAVAPHL
jgi:SPP1 gp7 family putative phage head morphogenesis protein